MEPSRVQCLEAKRRKRAAGFSRRQLPTPWATIISLTPRCSWICELPKIKLLECCSQYRTISNRWRRKNCRIFCLTTTSPIKACSSRSTYILRTARISSERSLEVKRIASVGRWAEATTPSSVAHLAWYRGPIHRTSILRHWKGAKQMPVCEGNMVTTYSTTTSATILWAERASIVRSIMLGRNTTEEARLTRSTAQ